MHVARADVAEALAARFFVAPQLSKLAVSSPGNAQLLDAALETLLLPFSEGRLVWPQSDVLCLNARSGASWRPFAQNLVCQQGFKPDVDALARMGMNAVPEAETGQYELVLALPPRQREAARAQLARALSLTASGGRVVACAANDEGARTIESDLARLSGGVQSLSKHKCRVFWTNPGSSVDGELLELWRNLDRVRPILDGRFVSRPGVFAWDRIDPASALLASHFPSSLAGRAADLGAGFGYLATELLQRCAGIAALDMYEADHRALQLSELNLASQSSRIPIRPRWHDVTQGLPERYDVIVTNPPFHGQRATERPDIGRAFISAAAAALVPGGRLYLVANRHLPYEQVLDAKFGSVRMLAQAQGFKVIEATRAGSR